MIGKIFKKLLGLSEKKNDGESSLADALRDKSKKFVGFIGQKVQNFNEEFFSFKNRIQNLRETNYKLGMKHLENGNITDAIFRFRFINKFWPDLIDAQYQLAYCLTLDNKPHEAKVILKQLLAHHPDYDRKAADLLEHIEEGLQQKSLNG